MTQKERNEGRRKEHASITYGIKIMKKKEEKNKRKWT